MKERETETLTFADGAILGCLVSSFAHAAADRYQPLAISVAVKFNWHINFLSVGYAGPSGCHQWRALSSWQSLWEDSSIPDNAGTLSEKYPHSDEGHAGSVVLKGQVEAGARHRAEAAHLSVDLHHPATQVHLWKALVGCDGVHLDPGVLHPWRVNFSGRVRVRLEVVEVEGLLARAWDIRDAAAVSHWELDLDMDALGPPPPNVLGAHPVVLIGIEDVAHLVGADGVHILIIAAHLLPLETQRRQDWISNEKENISDKYLVCHCHWSHFPL